MPYELSIGVWTYKSCKQMGRGIGRNKLNNMEFNIPWWKFNLTLSDLFQFLLSDLRGGGGQWVFFCETWFRDSSWPTN